MPVMRKKPALVSVGAGKSQLPLILSARGMGWSTIAVDHDADAVGFQYADVSIKESTHDTNRVVAALQEVRDEYKIEGVVARTTAAEALHTAAAVSREFNLPGLTDDLVQISTEKSSLREFCNIHGLPMPMGIKVNPNHGIPEITDFPLIVKPDRTFIGKRNVKLCRDWTHLETYVAEAAKVSPNQSAEIEFYVEGIDATCLCWAYRGKSRFIAWWDELVGVDVDDQVIGLGVSVPSVLIGTNKQKDAERVVDELVRHFPAADALFLVSFKITMAGEPYIIETHADLGGDLIADALLPTANPDFKFFDLAIRIATGSVNEVTRVAFKPTVLYYGDRQTESLSNSFARFADHHINQLGSVRENLGLISEYVTSHELKLSIWPKHSEFEFLNRDSSEKALIHIPCPLCGKDDSDTVYSRFYETGSILGRLEVRNVLCRNCGFMYVNPRPTKQILWKYYRQEDCSSGSVYHASTEGSRHVRLTAERRDFLHRSVETMHGMSTSGSLLDIGCSIGDLLSSLDLPGWQLKGLEPSSHAAKIALSRGIQIIPQDLESADLSEEAFDVVSCISILEHVYDIRIAMSIISKIVKRSGLVIIEVPDSTKPVAQISEFYSFEHLSNFTRNTLTRLLNDFGFEVVEFDCNINVPNLRVCAKKCNKGLISRQDIVDDRHELLAELSNYKQARHELEKSIVGRFVGLVLKWKNQSARVAIYGAGMHTLFLLDLVDFSDVVVCMLDTDPKKQDTRFLRWKVHSPQEIERLGLDAIIISSKAYQDEIYQTIAHYQARFGIEIVKCYP